MRPVTGDAVEMRLLGDGDGVGIGARINAITVHDDQDQGMWNGGHRVLAPYVMVKEGSSRRAGVDRRSAVYHRDQVQEGTTRQRRRRCNPGLFGEEAGRVSSTVV